MEINGKGYKNVNFKMKWHTGNKIFYSICLLAFLLVYNITWYMFTKIII